MGLFGKSEEKDDEGDTPPAVAKKDDDRHLRRQDSEAPSTVCPCACGNRFLAVSYTHLTLPTKA